jgi:hypothetical protein
VQLGQPGLAVQAGAEPNPASARLSGMKTRLIGAALLALGSPLSAEMLSPDSGDFKAEGAWTDQDGHLGQWRAEGKLYGGRFSGSLVMEMAGVTRTLTLAPAKAT